jgi:putative tryptophan/tyrosine transport system substrate-binding protein
MGDRRGHQRPVSTGRTGSFWRASALAVALGVAGTGSVVASAAPRSGPALIGALTESWGPTPAILGLRDGLVEMGHRENEHFVLGIRFTEGRTRELEAAARQLVERGAHILVTGGGGVYEAKAAQAAAAGRIPVVFMGGSDPVGAGLVESLARPGGNVTGIADLDLELAPKRLEIFQELVPGLRRVLLVYDATAPQATPHLERHREAARHLGVTLVEKPVRTQDEAQAVFASVETGEVHGILALPYLSLNIPGFVVATGIRVGLPTMLHGSFHVEQGGLASYAADLYQTGRRAARLVDRILKGAKPADLPVEHAKTYELIINLETAKAIGLTIPPELLLRADRLIP